MFEWVNDEVICIEPRADLPSDMKEVYNFETI